jgi:hypothetical protein
MTDKIALTERSYKKTSGVGARLAQPSIAAILGLSEPPCLSWIC